MKKTLRKIFAGAAFLLAGFAQTAEASHLQGSEMTYTCIAPGVYRVNLKLYRDCTGATAPSSAMLNLKSTGCNPGRSVSMSKVGGNRIGDPYCPTVPKNCNSTSVNYEEVVFNATVTFTQTELNCPDWIFSWSECCRPASANIPNAASYNLYSEAYLNLGTSTTPIHNSSPEFGWLDLVVPYVNVNEPVTISSYAIETDLDSMVYSLASPLDNPTTALAYTNYGVHTINHPSFNPNLAVTAPAGTFSAAFPMHSFKVDWTQPNPVATPYFDLNAQNGSLSFTPTAYFPNTPPAQGLNKYVVVVKIDEYRKINGQAVKIGSIRRDMFFTIKEPCPNTYPRVATPLANNQPITPNDIINLRPGTPLNFKVTSDDSNVADVVTMTSDASGILPGASFSVIPGNRPSGNLTWTPNATHVRDQIYYFRVTVQDNACPLKGVQVQTFGVRVSNTGGVTGAKDELRNNLSFLAFPNPYRETVSFKVNVTNAAAQEIMIYNILGQQVDKISLKGLGNGEQNVIWEQGRKQGNGQYIAKLISGREVLQTIQFTKMP